MHSFDPSAASDPNPDDPSPLSTPVMLRLLITLLGEDLSAYSDPAEPPAHLRRAVRYAPTPVLRGMLLDAAIELDRRKQQPLQEVPAQAPEEE